ncbi:Ger(x)C family spore germination protein [Bhargavaea ullalensis]|uniref:Ger(X)C family germination protein n=1 Tax=Bhargavaea ullalensis TaxID=1265685 RepID=A0ABV2G9D2_9BACL
MKRMLIAVWLLLALPLLSGCWDELYFKDLQIVTLIGIGGGEDDVTVHFSYPMYTDSEIEYMTSEASGRSFSDARNNVNMRVSNVLDISQLQVLLISDESAKGQLYDHLDNLFRTPKNRLAAHVALVQEEIEPYMGGEEGAPGLPKNAPDYLNKMLATVKEYSLTSDYNLQETCMLLFDEGKDLSLPLLHIAGESGLPELKGTALFRGQSYTGEYLDPNEGKMLNLLTDESGKFLRETYMVKLGDESVPVTIELIGARKNWDIGDSAIRLRYKIRVEIDEFPQGPVMKKDRIHELERQLTDAVEADMEKTVDKLQKAGSDAIGVGRRVRAFHPRLWKKGDWHDTFSELDIRVEAEVRIDRTGILD